MPAGSSVIIANRWQMYSEDYKSREDLILNVLPQFKENVIGGLISDLEKIVSDNPKLNFYIISQPVRPSFKDVTPLIDMYYLGTSYKFINKIRKNIGLETRDFFKPTNLESVENINTKLLKFADEHFNVYFIDRNTPICKSKNDCSLIINGTPLYCDVDHLSFYGGEIVGKFILDQINKD